MLLSIGRRCRHARLTFRNARYQLAPESLPGGAVTYWASVLAMAASAVVSIGAVLG